MTERRRASQIEPLRMRGSQVPSDGLTTINASMGWLIQTLSELNFPRGVPGGLSFMKSFQNDDFEDKERFRGSDLVGLYGITDIVHLIGRQHVGQLHMRYKKPVLEALAKQPWQNPPAPELEKLHAALSEALAVLDGELADTEKKTHKTLLEMKEAVDVARGDTPNRAAKAQIYLKVGELFSAFAYMRRNVSTDQRKVVDLIPIMGQIDDAARKALVAGGELMQGPEAMEFPLVDNKGEVIVFSNGEEAVATIKPDPNSECTIIDYAIGAVGARGMLNDKFSSAYQEVGGRLIGNASATLMNLNTVALELVESLQEKHPTVPKEEIEAALSKAAINFTPSTWMGIKKGVEAGHANASLEQHIHNLSRVDSYAGIHSTYRTLLEAVGVEALDTEALIPNTRYHYLGIINGIESHRMSVSHMFKGKRHQALENALAAAELALLPQPDEEETMPKGQPYFHKDSPLHQAPDAEMIEMLDHVLAQVEHFQSNRKSPIEGMQTLASLMAAGLESAQGVPVGVGAGKGR